MLTINQIHKKYILNKCSGGHFSNWIDLELKEYKLRKNKKIAFIYWINRKYRNITETNLLNIIAMTQYTYKGVRIRIFINEQGNPEFCASDVTNILGYSNGRKAIDDHCIRKGVTKRDTLTQGGIQQLSYLSEGNLYRLILKSDMPEAAPFESWVCDIVLPEIRKTGNYVQKLPDFNNPAEAARAWANEYESKILAEAKIKELEPKAEVFDKISSCTNLKPIAEIAKILGTGQKRLFEILRGKSILMKTNIPYQKYIDIGYFQVKARPLPGLEKDYTQTFVTSKGEIWLTKLIK